MTTLTVEIPQPLAEALAQRHGSNPSKVVAGAIALWLLQGGQSSPELNRAYLDAILPEPSGADAA